MHVLSNCCHVWKLTFRLQKITLKFKKSIYVLLLNFRFSNLKELNRRNEYFLQLYIQHFHTAVTKYCFSINICYARLVSANDSHTFFDKSCVLQTPTVVFKSGHAMKSEVQAICLIPKQPTRIIPSWLTAILFEWAIPLTRKTFIAQVAQRLTRRGKN